MAANRVTKKPVVRRKVRHETIGELLKSLGDIPADRVRLDPTPGTATKRDLLRSHRVGGGRLELVDNTLVENPMGSPEAFLAFELGFFLRTYLTANDLGFVYGADVLIEVVPGQVRGPDTSFVSWLKRPDRTVPRSPISDLVPDLAVEVLSPKNTRAEIARKLGEYFRGGSRLVWVIDPVKLTAAVYTGPAAATVIPESGTLDGGDVLPGFRLPLAKLFERLEKSKPSKRKKK